MPNEVQRNPASKPQSGLALHRVVMTGLDLRREGSVERASRGAGFGCVVPVGLGVLCIRAKREGMFWWVMICSWRWLVVLWLGGRFGWRSGLSMGTSLF